MKIEQKTKKQSDLPFFLSPLHFVIYSAGVIFLGIFIFFVYLMPQGVNPEQFAFFGKKQQIERESRAAENLDLKNAKCADVNSDGQVNSLDLSLISNNLGQYRLEFDLNDDEKIDNSDLEIVISQYNKRCL